MKTALEGLAVSQISVEKCQFVSKGIFGGGIVRQAESSLWEAVRATVTTDIQAAPWLNGAQIQGLRYDVSELNLKVTVWDKKLTRLGALCSHLYDIRLLESTIFGSRFQSWGWAESPAVAKLAVPHMVTQRAREHKILQDMLQRRLGRACLGLQAQMIFYLNVSWSPSLINATLKCQPCSPSPSGSLQSMTQTTLF